MKKLLFLTGLVCTMTSAQNINDVLRIGQEDVRGTARFQSLSGAFGALGGDLSAININPAGSAVFNHTQLTVTGNLFIADNDVFFGGTTDENQFESSDINQAGGVFVFNSKNEQNRWKKFALSFNYEQVQNFDNQFFALGTTGLGIDSYFLDFAQGVPLESIQQLDGEFIEDAYRRIGIEEGFEAQQAFLGLSGGILAEETQADGSTILGSNANSTSVTQNVRQITRGENGKFIANIAGQLDNNLYLGGSINFHSVFSERQTLIDEGGFNAASPLQFSRFDNLLQTEGSGFSAQAGAILKVAHNLRLGGSYQSPTWYRLRDNLSQRISSNLAVSDIDFIDFNVINFFTDYTIQIPSKLTGSAAIILGKGGFLSLDYSYQDFSNAQLRPNRDPVFEAENTFIASTLGPTNTLRAGAEFRLGKGVSIRGGYRFEESPFRNELDSSVGDLVGYSGGIGFNFRTSKLDFAFNRTEQQTTDLFIDSGLSNSALVGRINTSLVLSYTLKF